MELLQVLPTLDGKKGADCSNLKIKMPHAHSKLTLSDL